ncbi:MAG: glycosyltransferase, partial [Candidatus Limnocylindrales bacterium]
VELSADDPMRPVDPEGFERDLAGAVNVLMADPSRRDDMGRAGRRRAIEAFGWDAIARQTVDLYRSLVG